MTSLSRKIERNRLKEAKKNMKVKNKAIEVVLSDKQVVIVHAPRMKDLNVFLSALPSLAAISDAFEKIQESISGVQGMPIDVPDSAYDGIYKLLAIMSDIDVEDFKELPMFDGLAILRGLNEFIPKNPSAVTPETEQTELITTP